MIFSWGAPRNLSAPGVRWTDSLFCQVFSPPFPNGVLLIKQRKKMSEQSKTHWDAVTGCTVPCSCWWQGLTWASQLPVLGLLLWSHEEETEKPKGSGKKSRSEKLAQHRNHTLSYTLTLSFSFSAFSMTLCSNANNWWTFFHAEFQGKVEGREKKKRDEGREIFYLLAHSQVPCNSWDRGKPKPGARNPF